jgi:hypothetical protein
MAFPIGRDQTDRAQQLADGHLKGVEGISSSRTILENLHHASKPFALKMDGEETWSINPDLIKIDYDHPEELLAHDMALLKRIYNHQSVSHVLTNINGKMRKLMRHGAYTNLKRYLPVAGTIKPLPRGDIDSLDDLVEWYKGVFDDMPSHHKRPSESELRDMVEEAVVRAGTVYESEEEWFLREQELHVPRDSTLKVWAHENVVQDNLYEKWRQAGQPELEGFAPLPDGVDSDTFAKMTRHSRRIQNHHRRKTLIEAYDLDQRYQIEWVVKSF